MSGSAQKATRRDLRRAVGEVAASAMVEQSHLIARHDVLLSQQSAALDTLVAFNRHWKALTFRQRLRWVLTGRLDG